MEIQVLGPVAAVSDGAELDLGPRLRRLLAALVVDRGQVVSTDRLIDIVWEGAPPDQAERTVKTYLTRLRNAVDPERTGLIEFRRPGYVLDPDAAALDSDRFEFELDEGLAFLRTGDHDDAVGNLRRALARWRGAAYAGMADEEWVRPEALRLDERRIEAKQALIEGWIATGSVERAVGEAQALAEAEPWRDRPRELLMRALFAAGRQADALREFRSYRTQLADESGLEPSDDLVEVEARIVRGDPSLNAPVRALRGYVLGERIGAGAHATVHRATQPGIGREVAIKIIRSELADRPDFVRRFEHEAQTVASVEHPHVVPLYDYWREPGSAYLVMRLMRGGSVEEVLRARGPYSQRAAIELLREVGGALEAAHRAGVVHRDVRPANLLLDEDGAAYLADFGVAVDSAVADGPPVLSPAHASPELLRGEPAGAPSDVLSLGVTAFEVLTGRPPFADSTDRAEVIRRQLHEPLPSATATRTDLPGAVDQVLARATAKVPDDRYATVAAFVDDLAGALGETRSNTAGGFRATDLDVANPYVGLHAFEENDADRFFGRETAVAELLDTLAQYPLAVLVGPSGCGKSSIVRAGLLPALRNGALPRSDRWFMTTMLPATNAIEALETALLRVAVNPPASLAVQLAEEGGLLRAVRRVLPTGDASLLLVIDQMEELFTLADSAEERTRFLTELAGAIVAPDSPLRVVGTLRADHYDAPLRHPGFADLVTAGTVTVRPMTPGELERAIVAPATHVGVDVERALVAELVAGVSERPAALPLLQFSLTETFDRRVSAVMLTSVFHDLGGLTGAVAARADRIIDVGGPSAETAARRIFGRLVTLGDGMEDTRRRARRSELGDDEHTKWLLDAFGGARLLTFDHDPSTREPTVELAHEAMLRDWPRLRRWLDEDRSDLRTRVAISTAAAAWSAADRDPAELLRSGRLELASELDERRSDLLNEDEHAFVRRSQEAAAAHERERAEAVERERRQNRRLRGLLAATGVLLVVALVAAGVALVLRDRAEESEQDARAAEAEAEANADAADASAASADAARADAEIERLVAQSAAQLSVAPDRAILLALEANRRRDDAATQTAVHRAIATEPRRIAMFPSRSGGDDVTRFAPGGVAAASLGPDSTTVEGFDPLSGESTWLYESADVPVFDAIFSYDASRAALVDARGTIVVVDRAGRRVADVDAAVGAGTFALDESGRLLAHVAPDSSDTRVVDVESGEVIATHVPARPSRRPGRVLLSADGETLLIAWEDRETGERHVDVVDATTGLVDRRVDTSPNAGLPTSLALDAEARNVAIGFDSGLIEVSAVDGSSPTVGLRGHVGEISQLSLDGDRLASAGADDQVRFWTVTGDVTAAPLSVPGNVDALTHVLDGSILVGLEGGSYSVVDPDGSVVVEGSWPFTPSQVFPAHATYATPSPDFTQIELRRFSDGGIESEIDISTALPSGVGGLIGSPYGNQVVMVENDPGWGLSFVDVDGSGQQVLDLARLIEETTGTAPGPDVSWVPRPTADGARLFLAAVTPESERSAAWFDLSTGELIAGPITVPALGPAIPLADGRVVIGDRFAPAAILPADLEGETVIVDGSEGFRPYDIDEATGLVAAGGAGGLIGLIDPATATASRFEDATGRVDAAAFSPDGSRLAVATAEDGIQIYDVTTGRRLGLPTGEGAVGARSTRTVSAQGVHWGDADGVWTALADGPVQLSSSPERWREIGCDVVRRELTTEEWATFVSDSEAQVPACPPR